MENVLYQYQQLDRTTWAYISSLMTIALYFKFSRFWSVRNLDLIGLIAIAPGMIMAASVGETQQLGFVWLFGTSLFFLIRMLVDPVMVRRPLLEPNLSPGGLAFMVVALMAFLIGHLLTIEPSSLDLEGARRFDDLVNQRPAEIEKSSLSRLGPAYALLQAPGSIPASLLVVPKDGATLQESQLELYTASCVTVAMLCQIAIVVGIVLIGFRHFGNIRTGVAAAGLYLILPYTAQTIGRVEHGLPAALLVWAIVCYRRPLFAGMLLSLAAMTIYYPLFLLPLWLGFYWQRGLVRFCVGFLVTTVLVVGSLAFTSVDMAAFLSQVRLMFGWTNLVQQMFGWVDPAAEPVVGFWSFNEPAYRITVFVLYAVLCGSFALWPAQKNLGTLLSCSAAVMIGTQFWVASGGGQYVTWYLPLMLLTILRPNLEDRVALSVLGQGWLPRRRAHINGIEKAA